MTDALKPCLWDVYEAALSLRNSGYDGPFIGDVCRPLFDALAKVERELAHTTTPPSPPVSQTAEEVARKCGACFGLWDTTGSCNTEKVKNATSIIQQYGDARAAEALAERVHEAPNDITAVTTMAESHVLRPLNDPYKFNMSAANQEDVCRALLTEKAHADMLAEALQNYVDAKAALARFEAENPNDCSKRWDKFFYAFDNAQSAFVEALAAHAKRREG